MKLQKNIKDTIPRYHISAVDNTNSSKSEQLHERYHEVLLKKTKQTTKDNKNVKEKLRIAMGS